MAILITWVLFSASAFSIFWSFSDSPCIVDKYYKSNIEKQLDQKCLGTDELVDFGWPLEFNFEQDSGQGDMSGSLPFPLTLVVNFAILSFFSLIVLSLIRYFRNKPVVSSR